MDLWAEYADITFWIYPSFKKAAGEWVRTKEFKRKCEMIALRINQKFIERDNQVFVSAKRPNRIDL